MDVDEVLERLGKWGKFQIIFYIILSITNTFPAAWHMLAIVFIGGPQIHHCAVPDGLTLNDSLPIDTETKKLSTCKMYDIRTENNVSVVNKNSTIDCANGFKYSGDAGPTIVSEWDLVCDRDAMKDTTQTIMIIGVMFGAMLFSTLSDRYGRKPVFLFSEMAMVVVGIATVFVHNYYLFCVLRFCAGALQQGIILTGFVMACELFPASMRTAAGLAIENFWATAMCLLALFGYLIRDWRLLQLTISIPAVISVGLFWILPESVPWLIANDRLEDAEKIIKRAAKFNNVKLPDRILSSPEQDYMLNSNEKGVPAQENNTKEKKAPLDRIRNALKKKKKDESHEQHAAQYSILDVFRNPRLRLYALIMCLLWFVNSLVYYGLSLSTSELAGDRYLNFLLSGLVEIPAYTFAIFVLQRFGRRWPLAIFHIVAGVALAVTLFIPKKTESGVDLLPLIMTLNMVGKFGITGSFGTVFLYAPEIFPTTLRNQAMGISSVGGRLGNMLAPFSSLMAKKVPWLPGIMFGSCSIAVGLLTLLLPETLNRPLPQTIEDINSWTRTLSPEEQQRAKEERNNAKVARKKAKLEMNAFNDTKSSPSAGGGTGEINT